MKPINLGILAHVDAGKTTVTEALLYHSGVKREMGRVDSGTTTTDAMALERQRGMTIRASTVSFTWEGVKINLIDTPGHMEFIAEVERALSVLDGVILVLSAREGVQSQTRVIFEKLKERKIPTLLFVNKLDRVGADLAALSRDIAVSLSPDGIWMQAAAGVGTRNLRIEDLPPDEGTLQERILERSDALLERYVNGEAIAKAEYAAELIRLTRQGKAFPIWMGAALHDIGVAALLPAVAHFLCGQGDVSAPLSARVYKVEWAEARRKRIYLRVFEGALDVRAQVALAGQEQPLRVKALYALRDGRILPTQRLEAGDIGLMTDEPGLRCGDLLGVPPSGARAYPAAVPLLHGSMAPELPEQRAALLAALTELVQEDPFLELRLNERTDEICLRFFGALQAEILQALLLERYGLPVRVSALRTVYKQTPCKPVTASIRLGQAGNFHRAGIALSLEPLPAGSGVVYETRVSYGDLEKPFQNGAREGLLQGLGEGLGEEVTDVKLTFLEADYDSVTGTPAAFRRLGPEVVRLALETAGVRRLEPWQRFTLRAPLDVQRQTLALLHESRAVLESVTADPEEMAVRGRAPLEAFQAVPAAFQVLTKGRGLLDVRFDRYLPIRA